jgi:alpha-mannosidase
MTPERAIVFLPCHTLDDFPTWLAEAEADDLLSAWTAAWHPWLIAAVGGPPRWASIDLPIPAGPLLGIVPATWDDRFAAQFDASCTTGSCFVRRTTGVEAIVQAAGGRLGASDGPLPGSDQAADFQALGLAILLAELLARRMRSTTDLDSTGVADAVVAAARAAVDGRAADVATALQECFDALSVVRARFYPVDSYVVDLVLLASTTGRESLARGIDSPVPLTVLASGDTVERLAAQDPAAAAGLRAAVATGRVAACGGRDADRPLDDSLPEELLASFQRGRAAWLATAGVAPTAFGRISGGGSTLLPQLLAGLGYEAGLWTLFDGGRLPDVGGGMIRFESAGAAVELLASTPLDARSARTVLGLPEALGEAMDRDHVAALLFAHYAGTASRWHGLIRRIARSTNLLGTFVTPQELVRRTPGTGTLVSLEPDAFPPALPQAGAATGDDLVGLAVAAARVTIPNRPRCFPRPSHLHRRLRC